jgi:DNA-binding MarR family transcriptional regulator
MIAQTSVAAYHEHRASGHVTSSQQAILNKMMPGRDYSLSELSAMTGVEKSSVSGRINEMLETGAVVISRLRACKVTGKTVRATKRADQ